MHTERDEEGKRIQYTHRVYGKKKTDKKFMPMNLRNGTFTGNLIYASMLNENDANTQVKFLNENNPEYVFEARKMKQSF